MSFVNKIKSWGKASDAEHSALDSDVAVADDFPRATPPAAPTSVPRADIELRPRSTRCRSPATARAPTPSIISAETPSEIADFTETRLQGSDTGMAPLGATLPLIGNRPAAEQQRILLAVLGIGLFGLIVLTAMSFVSAGRGSAQVAASGQALMQSQRLAKSVSQALTGNPTAFPEVKESAEVLASNVRSLKNGDGPVAAAPSGVQDALDAALPLVDRAEKSATTVVAQQKALTEVGQSLRAINRQSVDLLESSEAILSLKLQRDTSATEVSALGQLVMLTQRIGKSANEFLTAEGVNPEAVVLLSKDLNSFNEITKGLLDGNPQMSLPGTRDPQVRERLIALNKQYQETRARGGVILDNLAGLNSAREAQNVILADSEPLRKNLETVQERLGSETGFGGTHARLASR